MEPLPKVKCFHGYGALLLLGILHAICKALGQLVQDSNKIQANSADDFRDDVVIDARKHHFKIIIVIIFFFVAG